MLSVVHLDADAFFAAVEQAADPRLRGKPVAVGGERRGIIASASYEARGWGVYTPMPTARARKLCPRLIVLPGDFEKYERFSRWMFSYAYDFTPDVEICSIDEGYFDLTGVRRSPLEIAATIRDAIRQALRISVSEGIGTNKLVSQIASKLHKPAAFEYVPPGQEVHFLHPLPNRWLPGVGPKTAGRLDAAGLALVRQIAATPLEWLSLLVGNAAPRLKQFANGIDERPVVPASEPAKSYGQQETFAQDQTDATYIEAVLRRMADRLFAQVRVYGKSARTLTVKVRYNDMAEDQAGESLAEPTDLETDVYGRLTLLLQRAWRRRVSLRLVALRLSNLYAGPFRAELPLDRPAQQHETRRRLADIVDQLREERGDNVLLRGHDFILREGEPDPTLRWNGTGGAPSPESDAVVAEGRKPKAECRSPGPPSAARSAFPAISLVVRSHYSFLNSTLSIPAVVSLAKEHGLASLALCDQGNLHGAVEFVAAAQAAGIKPVLGAEIRVGNQPVWLYVENQRGYANLCRMLRDAGTTRVQGTAPGDWGDAEADLVADGHGEPAGGARSSAAAFAELPRASLGDTTGLLAVSPDPSLAPRFAGRFYRAIANRAELRRYDPRAGGLPAVAVLPVHYATPADRWKFEVVQSIRTLTLLHQPHPAKLIRGNHHFRSPAELSGLLGDHPGLLAAAQEIADRCQFTFTFGKPQFPAFRVPDGSAPADFLRKLVGHGLAARYPRTRLASLAPQVEMELQIIDAVGYAEYFLVVWDLLRACRESGIEWITRGSAADSLVCYCLGISSVCPIRFDLYFRRFLNPERMALQKLPDIDVDFPHDRKDDVLNLIFAKYGREHTAVVGGFSTFQARSAFAEVAKVIGVAEREVRRFTEHFPWSFGARSDAPAAGARPEGVLAALLRANPECGDLPLDEEPYRSALLMAEFLDGVPRYPKMHPCGVVLSRQPMRELTPTFVSQKGYPTTHFDMDAVEAIGLVKMDILAQGGLAVMRDVKARLQQRGVEVDLERLVIQPAVPSAPSPVEGPVSAAAEPASGVQGPTPDTPHPQSALPPLLFPAGPHPWQFEDSAVWELIAGGNARAVHHIESPAMISLCRMCNVRDIDTLVALVSVIRPGAANEDKKREFARRYQGLSPVTCAHPSLEPCLRSTFGLVVYEEHILQICEAFAGLPPGRADVLRRALVKERQAVVGEIAPEFAACARNRGRTEEEIERVWGLVTGFHGYAFCKAHSTAYAVEAYQSAWLKQYFPAEFMAGVLTNGKGFYRPLIYVLECWRLGIPLLPPRVNEPGPAFQVADNTGRTEPSPMNRRANPGAPISLSHLPASAASAFNAAIRVPVAYVQSITTRTQERILSERERAPFASLADFYLRVGPGPEEMETLARVGALDGLGGTRCEQFWEIQHLRARWGSGDARGQGWLFPLPGGLADGERSTEGALNENPGADTMAPAANRCLDLQEPGRLERLRWEMELLGFPASGHPLELYPDVAWETYCPVDRVGEFVGAEITLCGLVIEGRVHHQATGEPMKFLTLADWSGMIETELFAQTYKTYGLATIRYPVLEVTARVEPFENGRGYTLRVLRAGQPRIRGPCPPKPQSTISSS